MWVDETGRLAKKADLRGNGGGGFAAEAGMTILTGHPQPRGLLPPREPVGPPHVPTEPADRELGQCKQPRERRSKYTTASHIKSPLCPLHVLLPNAKKLWAQKGEGCLSKKTTPLPPVLKV